MTIKGPKNVNGLDNGVVARLSAEKKKFTAAILLVGLMVFMWARVLLRSGPEEAKASISAAMGQTQTTTQIPSVEVSFIDLPRVKGRNDRLSRDFFDAKGWKDFDSPGKTTNSGTEVTVVSLNKDDQIKRRIAEKLQVQAIWLGDNPQVFINDHALSVGDKFVLKEGTKSFECEVVSIEERNVVIRCGEARIELKLLQTDEKE